MASTASPTKMQTAQPKTKKPRVTGAFLLKQRPVHLLDDLKEIIESHGGKLSASCTQDLSKFLEENLEPHSIPFDPKRPGLQADLDNSARLRNVKRMLKASPSQPPEKALRRVEGGKISRFNGPRNVTDSFMDTDEDEPAEPSMFERPASLMAAEVDTMYRKGPFHPIANRLHGAYIIGNSPLAPKKLPPVPLFSQKSAAVTEAPVKVETPVKVEVDQPAPVAPEPVTRRETLEHGPNGVNASFYLPHDSTAFAALLSQVDRSVYETAALIEERADDYLDVGDEEPVERAPLTIAGGHTPQPTPVIKISDDAAAATSEEMDADVNVFTPGLTQTPPPVPTITVTEDTTGSAQSSVASSQFSAFEWSPPEVKQDFQETPNSTILDQSPGPSTQTLSAGSQTQGPVVYSQSRFGTQVVDPADLLKPSMVPAAAKRPKPVATNPRHSARLAKKSAQVAPAAPAPAPAPPVLNPSVKRRRKADVESADEQAERGDRHKRVDTKTTTEE